MSKVIDVTNPAAPTLLSATTNSFASQGVAAAGTLMYLASPDVNPTLNKGGLYVVNAAVPTAPTVLANVYGGFDGAGVAVAGSLAVAAGNTAGLRVVDVTVPTDPRLVGSLAGNMKAVAMAGQRAYVLQTVSGNPAHTDLLVVDLTLPATPSILGRVNLTPSITVGVKVVGSLAYVAAGSSGLQIVDVSTPATPTIIGTLDTPGTASGVAVANGYAYVADGTAVRVINVTSPRTPVLVASLATSASAVAVAGTRLYVLGSVLSGTQFQVVDISVPTGHRPWGRRARGVHPRRHQRHSGQATRSRGSPWHDPRRRRHDRLRVCRRQRGHRERHRAVTVRGPGGRERLPSATRGSSGRSG